MAAEDFKRRGHVGHFVVAPDIHGGFQITARHAPHPAGQLLQPEQQHAADEQPGDEQGAADADGADGQQQIASGEDRILRSHGGVLGVRLRRVHQAVDFGDQVDGDSLVAFEQFELAFAQLQFLHQQVEAARPA